MSKLSTKAGDRIACLLDAQSFVEIGGFITARSTDFNLAEKETPADGVITGYGTIDGNLVYVYSQDASVLGGSMGEMHAKKISALYAMAMKMGAPVIGLVDCAGLRLQEGTDALEAFGGLYKDQTEASGVIPQITAVFGVCGGDELRAEFFLPCVFSGFVKFPDGFFLLSFGIHDECGAELPEVGQQWVAGGVALHHQAVVFLRAR